MTSSEKANQEVLPLWSGRQLTNRFMGGQQIGEGPRGVIGGTSASCARAWPIQVLLRQTAEVARIAGAGLDKSVPTSWYAGRAHGARARLSRWIAPSWAAIKRPAGGSPARLSKADR